MVIYKTTNLINGKFYIGKDVRNLGCYLGSGKLLKRAIKKYGKHNFIKEILEVCDNPIKLEEREIFWIKELNSIENGYNLTEGGTGGDTFSNNPNKEEIRNKLKKRIISDDVKKIKINNLIPFQSGENHPNFGKKQSQETKEKRLLSFKKNGFNSPMEGKKHAEESKLKISKKKKGCISPRKGKSHTEESKQLIRVKSLGKIRSEETRTKMSLSKKGKPMKKYVCPYCGKEGGGNAMKQWHFEKCKNK